MKKMDADVECKARIKNLLDAYKDGLTLEGLFECVGVGERRIRRAVRSLVEDGQLVVRQSLCQWRIDRRYRKGIVPLGCALSHPMYFSKGQPLTAGVRYFSEK